MNKRLKDIISRVEEDLIKEGFSRKDIFDLQQSGFGDRRSFFELLVDLRLEGKSPPAANEVWDDMKKQLNFLKVVVEQAAEDYRKLENKCRGLKQDNEDLIKKLD